MPLIFEDSPKVGKRKIPITKKQQEYFGTLYNALEPHMGKNNLKNLKSLATNKTYNKKGKTSQKNGEEENVNYVSSEEARKRMERFPNDQLHQLAQGGQVAYNIYKKGLEKSRRQEKVPKVQPPKPTSNASLKVEPPKVKQIETPNGTISYNENKSPQRKIYLSESALNKLYEYYTQLKLPFKNDSGKGYDFKENYEHLIDFLEYIGKYGQLPNSEYKTEDIKNLIEKYKNNIIGKLDESGLADDIFKQPLNRLFKEAYINNNINEYFNISEELLNASINNRCYISELIENEITTIESVYSLLTPKGVEKYKEYVNQEIEYQLDERGFKYIHPNERGLLYVERQISMPSVRQTIYDRDKQREENYFYHLWNMEGVGKYWSWEKGNGEAYSGDRFNVGTDYVTFKGFVNPKSVDWEETVFRNIYELNEETEMFIKEGEPIEIDEIIIDTNSTYNSNDNTKGKNILQKPIIVPA